MKIAIIGTGSVGSALTRGLRRAGHEVVLGSRCPDDPGVRALAEETAAAAAAPAEADAGANEIAARLASDLGFDPVDAGPLGRARHLEHLAVLWIHRAVTTGNRRFGLAVTEG